MSTCRSTRTHYSDSEPTSHCSYFLILLAWQRSNNDQFYSLLCDPISLEPIRGVDANNYTIDMVLDQHALLDFYCVSSLKQQSSHVHVALLGHINPFPSQQVYALIP